jgi:hypothetical protein
MALNSKKKVIAINAFLLAALFGLVSLNKEVLRPGFRNSEILKILTGCFPNFIAAFLISMMFVSAVLIRKPVRGRVIAYLGSAAVFLVLMMEELKPMWGASSYYDPFDIVASGIGSLVAIAIFELINSRLGKRSG